MAKKRDDRVKEKKIRQDQESNLDSDYFFPVRSFRDLTFENIKSIVFHSRYAQILISLTLIGFILRFYNLGFNSLWLDEATTLNWSKPGFFEIWEISRSADFHPPLFHWIEHIMLDFRPERVRFANCSSPAWNSHHPGFLSDRKRIPR